MYNKIYANKRKIYIFTGSLTYSYCEGSLRTKITPNMLWKLTVDKLVCHTLTKFAHCKEDCAPAVMCIFSVFQISKDSLWHVENHRERFLNPFFMRWHYWRLILCADWKQYSIFWNKKKKVLFFFNSLWGLNTKITQERIDKRKNEEMDGWMTVQWCANSKSRQVGGQAQRGMKNRTRKGGR